MPIFLRLVLFATVAFFSGRTSTPCRAQDPFFGDAGGLFPADAAEKTAVAEEPDDNPLVQQLLEHSRRGHEQLADAISSLVRIGRWSDADRLLSQLPAKNLSVRAQADIAARIGPALYLRMKRSEELTDAAKAELDKLAAASVSQAESPERLRPAIADLDSDSLDRKLAAARLLLGGGNAAVSELVTAAVAENPPASRDVLLRTMLQLGGGGTDALQQLALYGTPAVRERAIESLARISRTSSLPELLTAAYATDSSGDEKAIARANLQRLDGGLPNRSSAVQLLMIDFQDKKEFALRVDNDDQPTTLWSVNSDRTGVTHQPTRKMFAAYRDAVDAGSRLRRLGGLSPDRESEILATDMAYRVMIDPDWGDPDQIDAVRAAYPTASDASAISSAIDQALARDDHAAAIGLIRLIDLESPSVLERSLLLQGDRVLGSPLVQAASSSQPQVRYEAALAAARLAQGAPYSGSSRVRRCLSEMLSLTDKPTAILVETRGEVVIALRKILADLGYRVEVVGSVGELQRSIARGGDLRLVLSKTELADLPPIEMIDLVRRIDRGRLVPIAFYGAEPATLDLRRWSAPTVLIERPASTAAFDGLMDTVNRRRRLPAMDEIDRQSYREAAESLL